MGLQPLVDALARTMRLDTADRDAVLALPHQTRTFAKSAYIVRDGDQAEFACVVLRGLAYRQKVVRDGGRQILAIHMKGDAVDLQNSLLKVADHSVQALTEADIAQIPREAVMELAFARPPIGRAMWLDTLVDASIFREWTANVGRRDARTRLAHLLCEFALRCEVAGLGRRDDYDLPMTQEELGDALGLTGVHVNRMLMELERTDAITRTRRNVVVRDWDLLRKLGDFQPDYLHLDLAQREAL